MGVTFGVLAEQFVVFIRVIISLDLYAVAENIKFVI